MNCCCIFVLVFCGVAVQLNASVKVLDGNDPGSCDTSNHAVQVLVRDREDKEKLLICTDNKGVYQWSTIDGSSSLGEFFNPGYDCSDILDNDFEAKDGFYWVKFDDSTPTKVYCDMTTDGGGFMLIGRKNSSTTWTVPSNDYTVEPYGFPHWSSALGDAPILDFRIQMATSENFNETKAHWSYRMKSKRPLKKLMIMNQGGCGKKTPGIGDIAYVKDLLTENIVTTTFKCSKFGIGYHPNSKLGWSMMNSCLQKPCPRGFAFLESHHTQIDYSGAFSYSVIGNISGIVHDATSFVGCSNGQCCGCYGPPGDLRDHCSHDCTALNGGTIANHVYTWFWVRSTLPKKVWNKCMEYKVTDDNGDVTWYKLIGGSETPTQGRCIKKETLLNDGIVVVPESTTLKKIPSIAGLLSYSKDNKELYVRANRTWSVIAQKKQVLQETSKMVDPKLKQFEGQLEIQNQNMIQLEKKIGFQLVDQNETQRKMINTVTNKLLKLEKKVGVQFGNQIKTQHEMVNNVSNKLNELEKNLEVQIGNLNSSFRNDLQGLGDISISSIWQEKYFDLKQLKQWLPAKSSWRLCYRASRDGWRSTDFHSRCDNKGATVTIIRVGENIFGGYSDVSWDGSSGYKSSTNSFIFSLRNKDNLPPFKAPVYRYSQYAIYCSSGYGPTFGGGHDIYIRDNAHSNTGSSTNFGHTYQPPSGYSYGSSNTQALLAGRYSSFYVSEIEVFYLR